MNEHKATNARPVPHILAGNHDFSALYKGFAVICYLFLTVHFACIMVLGFIPHRRFTRGFSAIISAVP